MKNIIILFLKSLSIIFCSVFFVLATPPYYYFLAFVLKFGLFNYNPWTPMKYQTYDPMAIGIATSSLLFILILIFTKHILKSFFIALLSFLLLSPIGLWIISPKYNSTGYAACNELAKKFPEKNNLPTKNEKRNIGNYTVFEAENGKYDTSSKDVIFGVPYESYDYYLASPAGAKNCNLTVVNNIIISATSYQEGIY